MAGAGENAVTDQFKVEDPRIGQVVQDRYRIVRRLGEGGMGIVYEGEHLMIKRRVAIKLLHTQFAADPLVVKRFHNEAIAATSIGNPHIVDVTDMGRLADSTFFMVLEFLEGHDFDHLIEKEGPQPLGRVVHILSQTCGALQAAHDKGIIHRDLKPENLYLVPRAEDPYFVKVLDFGIAKFMEGRDESMTQTGQTIGTPHFMSPEQLQGSKDLDARADLYALGVIMYHALTKRFPFEADTFPLLIMSIFNHPPVPITMYRKDLPPEIVGIIERLLAKNPHHRFSSAAELRQALIPFRQVATAPEMLHPPPGSGPHAAATGPMGGAGSSPGFGAPQTNVHGAMAGGYGSAPGVPPTMQGQAAPGYGNPPGYGSSPQLTPGAFPAAQPASKLPMVVALGALLVALAVVVVVVFGMNRDPQPTPQDDTPPPIAQPNPEPVEDAAPMVNVRVSATPSEAQLFLDGDPMPNPFDGDLPRGRETRRLEARLDGYVTETRMLSLRFPQRINIELQAEPQEQTPTEPVAATGRRRGGRQPAGTATDTPPSEQVVQAPPPVVRPVVQPAATADPGTGAGGGTALKRVRF